MRPELDHLRHQVRALEAARRPSGAGLATGSARLDAMLGDGVAVGAVSEIVPAAHLDHPSALAFALALASAALAARAGDLVWIQGPEAGREWGLPHAQGLAGIGIDPARVLLVRAPDSDAARAATEDAARTQGLACVLSVPGGRTGFELVPARRVQLAAEEASGIVLLAPGVSAPAFAPARVRLRVAPRPSAVPDWARNGVPGLSLPPLGLPAWRVSLERSRHGHPPAILDLEFDHASHCLREPAPLADRPAVAPRSGGVAPWPGIRRSGQRGAL